MRVSQKVTNGETSIRITVKDDQYDITRAYIGGGLDIVKVNKGEFKQNLMVQPIDNNHIKVK